MTTPCYVDHLHSAHATSAQKKYLWFPDNQEPHPIVVGGYVEFVIDRQRVQRQVVAIERGLTTPEKLQWAACQASEDVYMSGDSLAWQQAHDDADTGYMCRPGYCAPEEKWLRVTFKC